MVTEMTDLERIKELVSILNKAGKSYYSEGVEIMSNFEYDKLYDELCFKAENSIYKKRPASQAATLKNGQKTFLAITNLKEKAQVINNIITMFRCDATTTTNLKTIGGSANAGGMQVNKNTLTSQKVVLVHQSVTGLFDTEEELL